MSASAVEAFEAALSQPITAKLVFPPEPGAWEPIIRRVALPQCRFASLLRVAERLAAEHGVDCCEDGSQGGLCIVDTHLQRALTDDLSLLFSVQQACLESRSLRCAVAPASQQSELLANQGEAPPPPSMPPVLSQRSSSLLMQGAAAEKPPGSQASNAAYPVQRPQTFAIGAGAAGDEPISTADLPLEGGLILLSGAPGDLNNNNNNNNNSDNDLNHTQGQPPVMALSPAEAAARAEAQRRSETARRDEAALLQGTPFDAVCLKHVRRHLRQLEHWYLQQLMDLRSRESSLLQANHEEAERLREANPPDLAARLQAMEVRLRDQLELARARHRHAVKKLAEDYDLFLEGMNPETFLRPLRLRISIVSLPDCNFELEARPGESFDGLRHLVMDRMESLGLPIAQFGANSCFVVFPKAAASGSGSSSSSFGSSVSNSLFSLFRGNKQQAPPSQPQPQPQAQPQAQAQPLPYRLGSRPPKPAVPDFLPMPPELRPENRRHNNRSPETKPRVVREELTTRLRDVGVVDGTLIVLLGSVALRGDRLAEAMSASAAAAPASPGGVSPSAGSPVPRGAAKSPQVSASRASASAQQSQKPPQQSQPPSQQSQQPAQSQQQQQPRQAFDPGYTPGAWALASPQASSASPASAQSRQAQPQPAPVNHSFFQRSAAGAANQHGEDPRAPVQQQFQQPSRRAGIGSQSDEHKAVGPAPQPSPAHGDVDAVSLVREEDYSAQLRTLQDMGFSDHSDLAILQQALIETGGNVEAAIQRLLVHS